MLRSGHAPGHVRETFLSAIDAFMSWNSGEPQPTVEYEVGYVPRQIPISEACGLLWNCSDIMPRIEFNELADVLDIKLTRHAMRAAIKQ